MLTIAHAAHAAAGAEPCLPVFCQVFFVSCSSISCLESGDQAGPPRLAAKPRLGPHADATDATADARHYTRLPDPVVEEVRVVHPPPVVQHYRVVHHFSDMWYRLRGHYCGPAVNWHLFA